MRNEFTAIIERDGDWFIAYSPEVPGANGQGRTSMSVARISPKRSRSFLKIGARTHFAVFRVMQFATLLSLSEARDVAPPPP